MTEAEIPLWLKNLPLAPEYRPTETEFADPIAFISRIEREAASFGICKVIPPLPRPSKKFVVSNLSRSLSKSPELGATSAAANVSSETPVFTTRQQELGSRRSKPAFPKQVWQSGDLYTLEQFECKSKAFTRSQLGGFKEVTPLLVESLFWKAVSEKPIYIDYANDVPGSGFSVPEEPFNYISMRSKQKPRLRRRKLNEEIHDFRSNSSCYNGNKGISGWKLSNSPWNLQVIARSPGSLTRFMPDDVPGVTSPMVYIGMLFSWFAWHVEDHELHSMNFLHMGSPKTWYAVPQDHAATLEDIVRVKGYGESVDRLAAFTLLGEKTTLLSPEVLVASGVPCFRLVQHPGEFVITFPRAYHVGFSHGFNCGEAANFATPEWLKVAKEAAIRRAAMNHLPMLSHQQLLYILTMSFVSRIPRTPISGVRSSRMRDRKKEEREIFVKEAFLNDMMKENYRLHALLEKESTYGAILWEPGMLPAHHAVSQTCPSISLGTQYCYDQHGCCDCNQEREIVSKGPINDDLCMEKPIDESISMMSAHHTTLFIESYKNPVDADLVCSDVNAMEFDEYEGDLPVGLNIDSGSLACVSCGTLGYPFMAVMQPSEKASNIILSMPCEESQKSDKLQHSIPSPFFQDEVFNARPEERCTTVAKHENPTGQFYPESSSISQHSSEHDISLTMDNCSLLSGSSMDSLNSKRGEIASTNTRNERKRCTFDSASNTFCFNGLHSCDSGQQFGSWPMKTSKVVENDLNSTSEYFFGAVKETSLKEKVGTPKWDVTNVLLRPRIFCLQHAIEVEELLQNKGGGHIRIICHSDYLKFRGYASSIAEEVGIPLHLKDVPLENASEEDLNLVNLSIDEEEHQEDGKDWTSKLGVNLKYTVKQRKISSLTQEKLPSALSGMFSSCSTTSVTSLRWLLRKSRTRAKPVHIVSEKPHISANKFGGVNTGKETHSTNIKTFQVYKSRKKKTNDQAFKDHNHPVLDPDTSRQKAGVIAPLNNNTDNLFTVHISVTENHKTLQNCAELQNGSLSLGRAKLSKESCEALGLSVSELDSRLLVSVPVTYNYTRLNQNVQCSIYSDGGQLGEVVSTQLVKSSVVNKLITGIVIETDSVPKFHDSSCQPQDEQTQETLVSDERNEESDARFCLSAEDHTDFLSHDSEMFIEASIAQELGSPLEGEPDRVQLKSTLVTDSIAPVASGGNACPPYVFSVREERQAGTVNIKSYVRRKNKRKHEADQQGAPDYSEAEKNIMSFSSQVEMSNKAKVQSSFIFARSPCEGLRSRKGNTAPTPEIKVITDSYRKGGAIDTFECNIEGCLMTFSSKSELRLHKRDRCTYEKCGKRFSSHKYVMRHQRVHNEERPFKCPWKGCTISFKWDWARTEHLRVHTRERPYRCVAAGCGLAFRFVSDFSRHRRKTGHFGKR